MHQRIHIRDGKLALDRKLDRLNININVETDKFRRTRLGGIRAILFVFFHKLQSLTKYNIGNEKLVLFTRLWVWI